MTAPIIPIEVLLAEARRVVAMRKKVYPRWVATGKMTDGAAASKIAAMEAIAETLAKLAAEQRLL